MRSQLSREAGYDIMQHMQSGKGALKNPLKNWDWHHAPGTNKIQLIPRSHHIDPALQQTLHPFVNGGGGYSSGIGVYW